MQNDENLKNQIKQLIIESLNLEDYNASDISSSDPLFGEGLGLDSIDALELGIAIKKKFLVELDVEQDMKSHFASVDSLAQYIQSTGCVEVNSAK